MLALDIGGTKIAGAWVEGAEAQGIEHRPTPQQGSDAVLAAAADLVRALDRPGPVAVASAGVIDATRGFVTSATDAISGWAGTDLRGGLEQRLGVPVAVMNDVHAHTYGEYRFGAGRGNASMLLIAAGTGIGGGLVLNGQLVTGESGVAGHLGHVDVVDAAGIACPCGRTGHVEGLASGAGIEDHFERLTGQRLTGSEIASLAAQAGERGEQAHHVISAAGHALGRAIGGLLNAVDPGLVVLTGSVAKAGKVWLDSVRDGVHASAMGVVADTPIELAQLANAALVGAATWTRERTPS